MISREISVVTNFAITTMKYVEKQSATSDVATCKICTLDYPLNKLPVLQLIMDSPNITQKEIVSRIGKSK